MSIDWEDGLISIYIGGKYVRYQNHSRKDFIYFERVY